MNLSVVIPAYNEQENLRITIEELFFVAGTIPDISVTEVIVVDDHSSDNTYDAVKQMNDSKILCLRLSRRSGSHTAIRAGILAARGDAVLCISADGQDNPGCLGGMLKQLQNGCRVVWALRKSRGNESFYVKLQASLFYKVLSWSMERDGFQTDLSRADFFLLDRSVVDGINSCREQHTSLFGLIVWLGFQQGVVEYDRRERRAGYTKWSFSRKMSLAKDWLIAFSGLPLRIAFKSGLITTLSGICYAFIILLRRTMLDEYISGLAVLTVIVLVLGGLQLTVLGIMGEYVWRNLGESRKRPLYLVEKRTDR
jgi:dolichol-phosphate mannosyltransferase